MNYFRSIRSNKMKILDLFCGMKSIANAFSAEGFGAYTLDNDIQFSPDIWTDILDWGYRFADVVPDIKQQGFFDVIWASPPCEAFSVASISTHWEKNKFGAQPKSVEAEHSIQLVEKTVEIIRYYKPRYWFIENPRGMLRTQLTELPRQTITYCQYGDTRMKPTDIWGVFPKDFPIRKCKNGDSCHEPAPRGSRTGTQGLIGKIERARIPERFCHLLAQHIKYELGREYD